MTGPRKRRSMDELLRLQENDDPGPIEETHEQTTDDGTVTVLQASAVPQPVIAHSEGDLSPDERSSLTACELALDNLRLAFAAAGKALQVIRDARLYRTTHPTFEAYVENRWSMTRAQAYRLIAAWPLAARLSPIGDNLTESQVRELIPFAAQHGGDAAEVVYRTVVQTDGVKVTAGLLKGVIAVVPSGQFDPDQAVPEIRAYLTGGSSSPASTPQRLAHSLGYQTERILHELGRLAQSPAISGAANGDHEKVRQFIAEVRELLDSMEGQVSP